MNEIINNAKLNRIIQIMASLFWTCHFGELLYLYHYTDILFSFMYPNWTLTLFIFMSLIGVWIGLSVFLKKREIKNGYYLLIGLLVIGLIIDLIVVS